MCYADGASAVVGSICCNFWRNFPTRTAAAVRASVNSVIDPVDQTAYQSTIEHLQEMLGEETFHMAWTEGEAAPATQVMDYIFVKEDDSREL